MKAARSQLTREERGAHARRERARVHLERVGRGQAEGAGGGRGGLRWAAACLLLSIAAGAGLGRGLVSRWSDARPRIEAIHVQGARRLPPEAVARASGVRPGAAAAEIDRAGVSARLEEQGWIAEAHVLRLPSGPLLIGIRERTPVAVATGPQGRAWVDEAGTPFAPVEPGAEETALPQLRVAGPLALGHPDERLAEAAALARRLPERGLPAPEEIWLAAPGDPEGLSLKLEGLSARIVLGRDPDERLDDLARLLAADLPELAEAASLDLRFAQQGVLRESRSGDGAEQAAAERGGATPSSGAPSG